MSSQNSGTGRRRFRRLITPPNDTKKQEEERLGARLCVFSDEILDSTTTSLEPERKKAPVSRSLHFYQESPTSNQAE